MDRRHLARFSFAGLGVATLATLLALRGPLNPPAGPVSSSYKTLFEVEPRVAVNATNTPGDAGSLFRITQPGSYYLTGNIVGVAGKNGIEITANSVTLDLNGFELAGVAGSLSGVSFAGTVSGVCVRNGLCRNWDSSGIGGVIGGGGSAGRVENVRCFSNGVNGIMINNATISGCSSDFNGGIGIRTGSGCTIIGCSTSVNGLGGILASSSSVVAHCAAYTNTGYGINVINGSTVVDCSARSNTTDGIVAQSQCSIRSNTCSTNGTTGDGAGIVITGTDNLVEGNNCTQADRGIEATGSGNFIARNRCSGNTLNWSIVGNNKCLVVIGANAVAISGDSGGVAPGSTDPNANFTY